MQNAGCPCDDARLLVPLPFAPPLKITQCTAPILRYHPQVHGYERIITMTALIALGSVWLDEIRKEEELPILDVPGGSATFGETLSDGMNAAY